MVAMVVVLVDMAIMVIRVMPAVEHFPLVKVIMAKEVLPPVGQDLL
jgi:hypothetical protein